MPDNGLVPEATLQRLSLYHSYLKELLRTGGAHSITPRDIAGELGLKEETVRRDISFVGATGRPGKGYETGSLLESTARFLGIPEEYPIVKIGTARTLRALDTVFPEDAQGLRTVAVFSELPGDRGEVLDGVPVQDMSELSSFNGGFGTDAALVACSAGWVQVTIDRLSRSGIKTVLLVTPVVRLERPRGVNVTHLRVPCDMKSLACRYGSLMPEKGGPQAQAH